MNSSGQDTDELRFSSCNVTLIKLEPVLDHSVPVDILGSHFTTVLNRISEGLRPITILKLKPA